MIPRKRSTTSKKGSPCSLYGEKPRAEKSHEFIVTGRAGRGNRVVGKGKRWNRASVWREGETGNCWYPPEVLTYSSVGGGRTELLAPLVVGRPVLGEAFLPRADVLASLAAQKKNVGGGDLKRPKGGVVLVEAPSSDALSKSMLQEVAGDTLLGRAETSDRRVGGLEPEAASGGSGRREVQ